MIDYLPILIFAGMVIAFAVVSLAVSALIRPSRPNAVKLANALPSQSSRDYGRPFIETFKSYDGDFYAIDPLLFSPAEVVVTSRQTGRDIHAGGVNPALIDLSFGYARG